jgi:hypothetical protein
MGKREEIMELLPVDQNREKWRRWLLIGEEIGEGLEGMTRVAREA